MDRRAENPGASGEANDSNWEILRVIVDHAMMPVTLAFVVGLSLNNEQSAARDLPAHFKVIAELAAVGFGGWLGSGN